MFTAEQIAECIRSHMEPTEPINTVFAFLKEHEGKRVDKRLCDKLSEVIEMPVRITQIANMTSLEWGNWESFCNDGVGVGGKLLMAYKTKYVNVDNAFIHEYNTQYTKGLPERNAQREQLLQDRLWLEKIAITATQWHEAATLLHKIMSPFNIPDTYYLGQMFGWDSKKGPNK